MSFDFPDRDVKATVYLRRAQSAPDPEGTGFCLSHSELAERHGASAEDIRLIEDIAAANDLNVLAVDGATRSIVVSGSESKVKDAFLISPTDPVRDVILAVLGLEPRPVAKTNRQLQMRAAALRSYTPREVADLYNFPKYTGANQTIALIELGGGYGQSDLAAYWCGLGMPGVKVEFISVDGAANQPDGNAAGPDSEVLLDIEVAGAVAPGATIAVYFGPNTDEGFLNALNAAIHDQVRKPSVISISWGAPECNWSAQTVQAFDAALHDAALLGITVCAAAGDNGSSDGVRGGPHVDFPASSPWVLACGGTRLLSEGGRIQLETAWNDDASSGATGGGVSVHFPTPSYQAGLNIPQTGAPAGTSGRGVPDVAGVADPVTGYRVLVDGKWCVQGGTSAVAPLWSGLIALCNEGLGRNLGWFHPVLYGTLAQRGCFNDVVRGTNGAYATGTGWDCCTGLGTPNGQAILDALKQI